jgi:hypothetical protein
MTLTVPQLSSGWGAGRAAEVYRTATGWPALRVWIELALKIWPVMSALQNKVSLRRVAMQHPFCHNFRVCRPGGTGRSRPRPGETCGAAELAERLATDATPATSPK